MPCAVESDCPIDFCSVDGLDDTLPPVETGAAAFLVLVGFGMVVGVAVGTGVEVDVAVGLGVWVGWGVRVGVAVGGVVAVAVAVGGSGVAVGRSVGTTVGKVGAAGALHAAITTIETASTSKRRGKVSIMLLF